MSEQDLELEAFSKFIVALEPWLGEVVLVGESSRARPTGCSGKSTTRFEKPLAWRRDGS